MLLPEGSRSVKSAIGMEWTFFMLVVIAIMKLENNYSSDKRQEPEESYSHPEYLIFFCLSLPKENFPAFILFLILI